MTLGQIKKYTKLYKDENGSSLEFLMGAEINRDIKHDGVNLDGLWEGHE